jgi:hypothetical protein
MEIKRVRKNNSKKIEKIKTTHFKNKIEII